MIGIMFNWQSLAQSKSLQVEFAHMDRESATAKLKSLCTI
jgi:hypothetical protein